MPSRRHGLSGRNVGAVGVEVNRWDSTSRQLLVEWEITAGGVDGRVWGAFRWVWHGEVGGRSEQGANKGHPLLPRRGANKRSEQGTPTPATQCGHVHLPQPLGSERPHVDHVVGAGAGTGGNVVRRSAGKDAWCPAVVASEGLRDTHRPKWVSPNRHPGWYRRGRDVTWMLARRMAMRRRVQ